MAWSSWSVTQHPPSPRKNPRAAGRPWTTTTTTTTFSFDRPISLELILALGALILLPVLVKAWYRWERASELRKVAVRRRRQRDVAAQTSLNGLPPVTEEEENRICKMAAHEIAHEVTQGRLSAQAVLSVFARRAHIFGLEPLNCVTEEVYQDALKEAEAIDRALSVDGTSTNGTVTTTPTSTTTTTAATPTAEEDKEEGRTRLRSLRRKRQQQQAVPSPVPSSAAPSSQQPPAADSHHLQPPLQQGPRGRKGRLLEGVPISIKENFVLRGTDATCGLASRCFQPSPDDGLLVELLRDEGAIPYVKCNVPQALLSFETINNIYGRSLSPWDPARTPGGSTGGDAGLLAVRASPLAIGSDIGGSIRMPSHFCGLYGFKPTTNRVSKKGMTCPRLNNENGATLITAVAGPMGHTVHDLSLVMQAWWGTEKMFKADPYVTPKLFDHEAYNHGRGAGKPLRIGLVKTDHHFEPCPAVKRALEMAGEGLRGRGHEVVEVDMPRDGWDIIASYYEIMGAEGSLHFMLQALEGEDLSDIYTALKISAAVPDWVRAMAILLFKYVLGEHRMLNIISQVRRKGFDVREFYERTITFKRFQEAYVQFMKEQKLDALVLPVCPLPAFRHGRGTRLQPSASYLFLLNLLQWPSGVCPITLTREDEQTYDRASLPLEQRDSMAWLGEEQVKGSVGLPIGLQVTTVVNEDELCLHVMSELEKAMPFKEMPPAFDLPS